MDFNNSGGASSSSLAASSSTSSNSQIVPWWTYDVFVSFRGEDTRKNFTDHLWAALDRKGIVAFRDDKRLERGKPISPELVRAIEESRFSIVVFSRNYASSSWCLDELVKIVECMKVRDQTVLPVFYDVSPTEVRKQNGSFLKAFEDHEKAASAGTEKLQKWRSALTEVANLSGWDLQDRHESTFIQEIVEEISTKLIYSVSSVDDKELVGIDYRLQELDSCLGMGSDDVRIIGIRGMGGIGKTTIATIIYDRYSSQFQASSFVANVRGISEKFGLPTLQEQIISDILERNINIWDVHRGIGFLRHNLRNKRIFMILDDVDRLQQLEALAGDPKWFRPGSRIIVTTRDEHLLIAHGVDMVYEVKILGQVEALELFSLKAFRRNRCPAEEYVQLSKRIVNYANGLPLALVVLGSFLCGRSVIEWESALKRLEENPDEEIFDVLKISYDGLKETEKKIFLDVSCFFNWRKVNRVTEILECCDLYPAINLRVLIDKSLISIDSMNELNVHSLLQEMARAIVQQESPKEPGKRSRLWTYDDICHVLTNKTGTEAVEVIYQNSLDSKEINNVDADAFSRMHNLRLLKIHDVHPSKDVILPNNLRILKWSGYPLKSLPSNFRAEKLVKLHLPHSHLEQLWKGAVHLDKLRIIKLSHSRKLTRTPDFSRVPNIERLILEGCTCLYEVHPSIGDLKRLVVLNLKDCRNLRHLPSTISGWKSLKILVLLGCTKIDKLPANLGDFECLEDLDVGQTAIQEAPSSIVHLKNLKNISFRGCKGQRSKLWDWARCLLPAEGPSSLSFKLPQLAGLWSLTNLDLTDCSLTEGTMPTDLVQLTALKILNLSRNDFVSLPESICQLSNLRTLTLKYCQRLQALPELPSSIENLNTDSCSALTTLTMPLGLSTGSSYRDFSHKNCFRLVENQDNNSMALSLIKDHLCLMGKIRFLSIFSMFCKFAENQGSSNPATVTLAKFVCILKNTLLQDLPDAPFVSPKLEMSLSGIEIPDWFTHQTTNSFVTIELPPNWYNDHTFLGLAICATFEVQGTQGQKPRNEGQRVPIPGVVRVKCVNKYDFRLRFYLLSDEGNFTICGRECTFSRDALAVSDHLWLLLLPFDEYFQKETWRYVRAYFELQGSGFEFVKCGVRYLYLQDAFGQAMFRNLQPWQLVYFTSQVQEIFDSLVPGPVTQRSQEPHEHHSNDEAGTSGVGSCEDEETHSDEMREPTDHLVDLKGKCILE